jgi:hypothetical protein
VDGLRTLVNFPRNIGGDCHLRGIGRPSFVIIFGADTTVDQH